MRWRQAFWAAGVGLLLLALGAVTYLQVRTHIIGSLSDRLLASQNAQEAAFRLWKSNEESNVRGWANEPDLRAAVFELTDGDGGDTSLDVAARERLAAGFDGLLTGEPAVGYIVADRAGRIVAAFDSGLLGRDMPPVGIELLQSVLDGQAEVTPPFVLGDVFAEGIERLPMPVVIKAAAVRDQKREPVAALMVAIDPVEFGDLVRPGWFGDTGETYAVTRDGWLLSQVRFLEPLKDIGLIPDHADARSIFGLQIRDPGGDMTGKFRPELPPTARPLTLAAASVADGREGLELDGYRDYRGVWVMGAWRWLDDLGFGIITEIETDEALRPLHPLVAAIAGLFAALVLAAIGLLIYMRIAQRLRRQIDKVTQLGQYTLLEKIGEGGMGKVFRARHMLLARDTALKLLKPDAVTEETVLRFEQEVQNTAQLRHPNTVEIYDFGRTRDGIFYYVMEYLEGYDLAKLVEVAGVLPAARVIKIMQQVCLSLREAHGVGLIHRDIKPMNIVACARGDEFDVIKVVDFGLVKEIGVPDRSMTSINMIPGTPPYIAPERLKPDAPIDGRVDIYALGAVGFNLLTMKQPFRGDSDLEMTYNAMHQDPRRPSDATDQPIPPALDDLIVGMMARDQDARPRNVDVVLERLDAMTLTAPWNRQLAADWWAAHPLTETHAADADRRTGLGPLRVEVN